MENYVSVQTFEFLYSALFGICMGVLFDAIRLFRSYIPSGKIRTALLDLLFWIIAIISLLGFVLIICNGKMRWYVLVGTFCGCFIYMSAMSRIVYKVFSAIVAMLRKLFWLISEPFYLVMRWGWRTAKAAERKTEAKIRKSIKKR